MMGMRHKKDGYDGDNVKRSVLGADADSGTT